jgi:hypothetical protein
MRTLALLLILLFSCAVYAFESDEKGEWLVNYTGDIDGKYKIGMTLVYHGNNIQGVYFYNKYLKDIKLSGEILKGNTMRLDEYDNQGNPTAVFDGRFIEYANQDPRKRYGASPSKLDKEVIVGTWTRITDRKRMPFYLSIDNATYLRKGEGRYAKAGVDDDSIIEQSAQAFWKSVKSNNKTEVSKLISYPINVKIDGNSRKIKDKDEFLDIYDKIFTPSFKRKVQQSIPHNMFVKCSGVMLGNGEIWFGSDGKVIAIYN